VKSDETAAKPPASPLLSADPKATLTFSAEKDGTLRVLYSGWDDGGVKTFRPGEWAEVVARNGQVQVFRRGVAFLGPVPDPYLIWDGADSDVTAEAVALIQAKADETLRQDEYTPLVVGPPLVPAAKLGPIKMIGQTDPRHDVRLAAGTPLTDFEIVEGSPLEPIGTVR
jgi:hypothetical protein